MSFNANKSSRYRHNGSAKESRWDRANPISQYALTFMLPVFKKVRKGQFMVDDLGAAPRADLSRTLGIRLQHNYNQEIMTRREPSLLRALVKTFGFKLLLLSILDLLAKCIAFPMQTVALGWLIRDTGLYLNFAYLPTSAGNATATANATTVNATTTTTTQLPPQVPADVQFMTSDQAYWRIVADAALLMLFTISAIVMAHPFFFHTFRMGMQCRVAACYMVYKKSLRLSQAAMTETTVGQMVNLLSNDVNRFDQVLQLLPCIILAPLQAIISVIILSVFYLGLWPVLATAATILLYVGGQTLMGRGFSKFRAQTAKRTDERVRIMNEIILAMRIIKMYAWERPFKQLVYAARKREITTIAIASILKAINQTLFFVSSKIIVFVALITYLLLGNSFNPEVVFVTIGLANLIRISLTLFFPLAVASCAETIISCRRINKFLMLPEIESSPVAYKASNDGYGCKYALTMNKVYSSWASNHQDLAASSDARWAIIRNLTLAIRPRDLVLVVGRVGSGKTSVLMSMLGELPITSGRLEVNGRVSFASQEAWIFSGTVRENILFGKDYEPDRYKEVVRVCSLERDLEILIEGDSTIVGERGTSLSGGQKARVNLARALYQEADIYILDDPLSAVDAPVAKHIFNESLRTFLKKKTVILATHQLQFLRFATKVLVVDRESPAAYGTLQEVMESEAFSVVDYSKEAFEDATTTETGTDAEITERKGVRSSSRKSSSQSAGASGGAGSSSTSSSPSKHFDDQQTRGEDTSRLIRAISQASSNLNESVKVLTSESVIGGSKPTIDSIADDDDDDAKAEKKKLLNKTKLVGRGSERRQGTETLSEISADFSTYFYYLRNASGVLMFIWFLFANIAAQTLYTGTDFYLSFWTDSVQRYEYQGDSFVPTSFIDTWSTNKITSLYAILVASCFFATFCRTVTFFAGTLRASINIHDKLFNGIVRAPMTFFDFSPIGILLNRLSRDIGFVDETLPATAIDIITIFFNIGQIMILTIIIDYKNILGSIVFIVIAFGLRRFCAGTVTRLKQIEGVTRSPIFSHISTTLSGLPTIRAFKVQDEFMRRFDRYQDVHSSSWFSYICAGRWLAVSMDWLCLTFIVLVITLMLALSLEASNASFVGLLISQVVILPGPFQWGMRQLIEVESQMNSVQRIKEFSELESEETTMSSPPSRDLMSDSPGYQRQSEKDKDFKPTAGEVKFTNLSLRYFPDEPPVLKSINVTIRPNEKVGIVGRTGAGKSSIVAVLFRLYDFEGSIQIDGCDTKTLPLNQLRRSMSIIPQDPILFGGTVRKNLDPFNEYDDSELWEALEAVQLKPLFARYPQGLEYLINEGGANFSIGQRQLICLARAIVRRNKILILDEATANVDPETDVFIQRTIAHQFAKCTVITIAHRLVTVVDSDRVLVLDGGEVREFDEPFELIKNESSLFAQMVNSSAQQAPRLKKLIEDHHNLRKGKPPTTTTTEPPQDDGAAPHDDD